MIARLLESELRKASSYYPVVTLTGPRQSGKTTLIRNLWPEKTYLSLEDPDILDFAMDLAFLGDEANIPADRRLLVYGGEDSFSRSGARVLGWREALLQPA